jgi:TRAP-type C4-dicarboxylate transport system substrate-binding protein
MASPGHLGKLMPEVQVLLLHFVLSDDEAINRDVLSSPRLLKSFNEMYAEKNFQLLGMFSEGWQVWTTNKPVRQPKDFAGMKFRVMTSPLLLAAYEAYGASATPLPYSDVYSGLQLKMIDGQVNPIFAIEEMSFHEVTTHLTFANQAPFIGSAICNRDFYLGLPNQQRQWVDETVQELESYIFDVQVRLNGERLKVMSKERPALVIERLTEAQRDLFREASLPVRNLYRKTAGPRGEKLLKSLLEEVSARAANPE